MKKVFMNTFVFIFCFFLCIGIFSQSKSQSPNQLLNSQLTVTRGNLKLTLFENTGSFCLYYLVDKKTGTYMPLLSDYNQAANTVFFLQADSAVLKLIKGAEVAVFAKETETGAQLQFEIKSYGKITVDFTFLTSAVSKVEDALKISLEVTNTSGKAHTYALKAVFDTYLGENADNHFSTLLKPLINTEVVFSSMVNDKWILSSNGDLVLLFLLDGTNINSARQITLANRDILLNPSWLPKSTAGRSFTSPFLVNDSAIQIVWQPVSLNANASAALTFFVTASYGEKPAFTLKEANVQANVSAGAYIDSAGTIVSIGELTQEQLAPDYLDELIKRINELEKNPEGISIDEIKRLNAELDAITTRLKK